MAKTTKNEKITLTINGNSRAKSSYNPKRSQSTDFNEQNMLYRSERSRDRRNAIGDTTALNTSFDQQSYHQLLERVRELEKEIVPDLRFHQNSSGYSPFSALTPCSNVSGNGFPNYSYQQNFPLNLLSPNSSVPIQRYGLSTKVLERAHQIPERFWINWQQKQMQNRIEELENIKHNLTSPDNIDIGTQNRRKSLLLLHDTSRRISLPKSKTIDRIESISIENESPFDNHHTFTFDQRSIDSADTTNLNNLSRLSSIGSITPTSPARKTNSTLDRSRLTIFLPQSYTNTPKQSASKEKHLQPSTKPTDNSIKTNLLATSIEDIAQIDTEVNLMLLRQEKANHINPLLYSKGIMNRTIQFRSSSKKDS